MTGTATGGNVRAIAGPSHRSLVGVVMDFAFLSK